MSIQATSKYNLQVCNPTLAGEWDIAKNGKLTPRDITPSSHRKAWWICQHGHQWLASIAHRSNGRNCPYCSNRKVSSENSLAIKNPELAKEWHPSRNKELTPQIVVPGSDKKAWWKCEKNHAWLARIADRSKGKGCPYCTGRSVDHGNCLSTLRPELAKQWHPTKNGPLKPTMVTVSSSRRVWWICQKGHEWITQISNRKAGKDCPYCKNRKINSENCLASSNPILAAQWHPTKNNGLTPDDVFPNSAKKVWWQCKRNKSHEWLSTPNNRTQSQGCPFCSSATSVAELRLYTELKSIFPDIKHREKISKEECDIFIPSLKIGVEIDGEYWHKNKFKSDKKKTEHFEKEGIKLIRIRDVGLKKVRSHDIVYPIEKKDFGLVAKTVQAILELAPVNASLKKRIGLFLQGKKFENDKEFMQMLDRLPGPTFGKSLYYKNKPLAKQWHPTKNGTLTPQDVSADSGKKAWWRCRKGHEWEAVIGSRNKGSDCPHCSNQAVNSENCLAATNPSLAKEWHPGRNGTLTPEDVLAGSSKKAWWRCRKGHEWQAVIGSRNRGMKCPYCSNQKTNKENALATLNPVLAQQWNQKRNDPLTPEQVVCGSNKKVWWKCRKGHEWQEVVNARNRGLGCPYCSGRRACGSNSLATLKPLLAKEWNPTKNKHLTPEQVTLGSHKSVWWLCKNGHEWKTRVNHRSNGSGCPYCARKRK